MVVFILVSLDIIDRLDDGGVWGREGNGNGGGDGGGDGEKMWAEGYNVR